MSAPASTYLTAARRLIEARYSLRDEQGKLPQRNLQYLADLIEERSGIKLSLSTLKRLWRESHSSQPHPTTLNALVSVLDYPDWQSFLQAQDQAQAAPPAPTTRSPIPRSIWVLASIGTLSIVAFLILFTVGFQQQPGLRIKGPITFSADKTVAKGVPNTVIFSYDLSKVEADSFFIQQSWNDRFKERINPETGNFSSIYYFPGYHKAKLIANDSILQILPIHILTDGWQPMIIQDFAARKPLYLPKELIHKPGYLHINRAELEAARVPLNESYSLNFRMMKDFGEISSTQFRLAARLRCDSIPEQVCPRFELSIHCEKHIMYVPLTIPGCVSQLKLKLGDQYIIGRDYDLSGLSTSDIYEWQNFSFGIQDGRASVTLNGIEIYALPVPGNLGQIKGIDVRFYGPGAVNWVGLYGAGKDPVFEDHFD